MSIIEDDPRDINFVALYISIKWHKLITIEQTIEIAKGKSKLKAGKKPTPEVLAKIQKIMESPNFLGFENIETKYRVNRYDIGKGDFNLAQVEMLIKRLCDHAENCVSECNGCYLDTEIVDGCTFCEILCDIKYNKDNNLKKQQNQEVRKSLPKYTDNLVGGKTVLSTKIYEKVSNEFNSYTARHNDKKIGDIVSLALLEYMDKHK